MCIFFCGTESARSWPEKSRFHLGVPTLPANPNFPQVELTALGKLRIAGKVGPPERSRLPPNQLSGDGGYNEKEPAQTATKRPAISATEKSVTLRRSLCSHSPQLPSSLRLELNGVRKWGITGTAGTSQRIRPSANQLSGKSGYTRRELAKTVATHPAMLAGDKSVPTTPDFPQACNSR